MFVCLCLAVTDARVREAIAAGARDLAELGRRTGAGTDCGSCREVLARLIVEGEP
jgi:bacterioferritin-associated ferredoxin